MTWQTPWARRRAQEQALHLEALKAIQESSNRALTSLLTAASAEAALRAAEREAYLAAIGALRDVAEAQSKAVEQVADAIKGYLGLFQHNATVQGHVNDDYAEWAAEQQRLKDAGFPVEAPPADQLAWVLRESGRAD